MPLALGLAKEAGQNDFSFRADIAGLKYHEQEKIYHHLHEGTELRLVREYNNPFDEKAVAVYYRNFKLGFLPKVYNVTVSRMLDRGFVLKSFVSAISKAKYLPAESISIEITDQIA